MTLLIEVVGLATGLAIGLIERQIDRWRTPTRKDHTWHA
jgi:hypothetical protein